MATPRSQARASTLRVPLAHQQRHHGADRAGDARGIGVQRRHVVVAPALGIPGNPPATLRAMRAEWQSDPPPRQKRGRPQWAAAGRRRARSRRSRRRAIACRLAAVLIDQRRRHAAESIERRRPDRAPRVAAGGRPRKIVRDPPRSMARHASMIGVAYRSFKRRQRHEAPPYRGRAADERTPGNPAPGWVPAPTR